jgi:cytochrome c oxidase subunit 3
MAEAHAEIRKHPYHLVDPSPLPIIGALFAGMLAGGAVLYMHDIRLVSWLPSWFLLPVAAILVLGMMWFWWRDVIREATFQGHHTPVVQIGLRYGMALFIASEVMFFAAFFWAYFDASLFPKEAIGGVWPPENIRTFDPFELPLLNTLILLTSGVTVTWAHHALREGDREGTLLGLGITILLGATFTAVQAYEYSHAAFGFKDGIYPSTFFMATGFHG